MFCGIASMWFGIDDIWYEFRFVGEAKTKDIKEKESDIELSGY
jgi:hypothetical protein